MVTFLMGMAGSALVGFALWALLPRGVVLTRRLRRADVWEVRNESPLPVVLLSVDLGTHTQEKAALHTTPEAEPDLLVRLRFEDQMADLLRENASKWRGLKIAPGDALVATLRNNQDLTIRYRRAGWTGVLERREVTVHGAT